MYVGKGCVWERDVCGKRLVCRKMDVCVGKRMWKQDVCRKFFCGSLFFVFLPLLELTTSGEVVFFLICL